MSSTAPVDGLCSRMASAKLGSASSSLYVSIEDVSYQYWSSCCLNYDDQVTDGFFEVFGDFPEATTSKDDFPVLAALHQVSPKSGAQREVILFDSHNDSVLRSIVEEARAALDAVSCVPNNHTLACHRQLSLLVAGRLGGPQPKIPDVSAPSSKHIAQLQRTFGTVVVPIGQVYIGAARHRALLYKYLSDIFGLKTRVMKGRFYANSDDDARVIVDVNNGEEYEIDMMIKPGTSSPLEKRLALRASSREVAGTDVFSRASSVGGSTAGTANTAPASRSQSDAAHVDSIQAIAAAADAAMAAHAAGNSPNAGSSSGAPEPVPTPTAPPEAGLPQSMGEVHAATLEQAMQMAAAAAMGQQFSSTGSGGLGMSPYANVSSLEPSASDSPPPTTRFSFGGTSTAVNNDTRENQVRMSAPARNSGGSRYSNPSPYDSTALQGWPGQPAGFGSPMPSQSIRSSAPYIPSGEVSELRLSMGPTVGAVGANAAAGGDVLEEMGPAALISDASGQQYILQPVRASMDYSHLLPPPVMEQHASLASRLSEPLGGSSGSHQPIQRGSGSSAIGGPSSSNGHSGYIPPTQSKSPAELLNLFTGATTGNNNNNRSLQSLAENSTFDRGSLDAMPYRYSQPIPQQQYYNQYQQQHFYPPMRSSLPEAPILSSSLPSSGGGLLASHASLTGAVTDAAAMQWAAMQAAGGPGAYTGVGNGGDPSQQQNQYQQHTYNNQIHGSQNLDNMPYNDNMDVVSRLYLDSLRCNSAVSSVRMSVPIELEARQALLTRTSFPSTSGGSSATAAAAAAAITAVADQQQRAKRSSLDIRNAPPAAEAKPPSRSSGDGVPFPQPELPHLYTPFGAIDGTLTASGSDTVSPTSNSIEPLSREASLTKKAAFAAHAAHAAAVMASSRPPSASRSALSDFRQLKSTSTLSTLMSGGDGYLASLGSHDLVDDGWEIDAEELQLGTRIGIGSYGEVYRGQWRQTDVAIKMFLDQDIGARIIDSFRKEVAIMKKLRHPNIVQFIGACSKPPNLCIVTQYVNRGSLFKLLHRSDGNPLVLDERRRLQMALDVARGMNYLHTCRPPVIHRDLKSPNLLVDKDMTIKVCDFGLSRVRHATILSAKSQAGTPEWTAPEVLQGKPCNEASDVYSFGVILWELQTGEEPWSDKNAMQVVGAVGFANERLSVPEGMRPSLADLMARCFGPAGDRPSFSEIISILKRQIVTLVSAGSTASRATAIGSPEKNTSSGDTAKNSSRGTD